MGILLDFDMDFFTKPIILESSDNTRPLGIQNPEWVSPEAFFRELSKKGLHWSTEDVQIFTNHKKSYTLWWTRKFRDYTLIHVDAHSDLYRPIGRNLLAMGNGDITCYNYVWYGIRDNFVNEIYWVIPADHPIDRFMADYEINEMSENELLKKIIDPKMVDRFSCRNGVASIHTKVVTRTGEKEILIKVLKVEDLPVFSEPVAMVTGATSPEFMAEECDELIWTFSQQLKAKPGAAENIYRQHWDLIK